MLNEMKSVIGGRTIILALIILAINVSPNVILVFAQPTQEWIRHVDGGINNEDYANDVVTDKFGNVYVTGQIRVVTGSGSVFDAITIKYNSSGVEQWRKIISREPDYNYYGFYVCVDSSGNPYTAIYIYKSGDQRFMIVKYNPTNGDTVWSKRHNEPGDLLTKGLMTDVNGDVLFFAQGLAPGSSGTDAFVFKYDNDSGREIWRARYSGTLSGLPESVHEESFTSDAKGNVYMAIGVCVTTGGKNDAYTIKYDSTGIKLWERRWDIPGMSYDVPSSIKVDAEENVYVTGDASFTPTAYYDRDLFAVKYNAQGDSLWTETYTGSYNKGISVEGMQIDAAGNMYIGGHQESNAGAQLRDVTTIKYSTSGNLEWAMHYTLTGRNYTTQDFKMDNAGNVYQLSIIDNGYISIVKRSSAGTFVWENLYPYNNGTPKENFTLDKDNNIYLCGGFNGPGNSKDVTTIKYSQALGITNISTEVPEKFMLKQNYPNPFNPVTNIEFDIPAGTTRWVALKIYDITGKEVAMLVNQNLSAGTYRVDFDASHLSSGTYFYRLEADEYKEVKKMILIK